MADNTLRCPVCVSPLRATNSRYTSDTGSTDVYNDIDLVCLTNKYPGNGGKPCPNYAGSDLTNPLVIVQTIHNKVN